MGYKDDYAKSVFLHAYGNAKPLKKNHEYQRYLEFECGITSPRKFHETMISEGYLKPAESSEVLSSLKVVDLKTICDSLGISKTGKKADLVLRILTCCDESQVIQFTGVSLYSLSQKGIEYVRDHNDYIELHKHTGWGIELSEFIQTKKQFASNSSFKDVAWVIFNKRNTLYLGQPSALRNNYLNMAFLMKEMKNFNESLKYLMYVLFFDINEPIELARSTAPYSTKKEVINNYQAFVFETNICSMMSSLSEYYDESYIDEIYRQYGRTYSFICKIDVFKSLVGDILIDENDYKTKYSAIFKKTFEEYVSKNFSLLKSSPKAPVRDSPNSSRGCLSTILVFCITILVITLIMF